MTIQRFSPLMTGLAVVAALLLIRWSPPPRQVAFVLFPIVVAIPVVVLTTLRFARPPARRLAATRGLFALVAVVMATVIGLVAGTFSGGLAILTEGSPTIVARAEFAAVAGSVGSLAGWFVFVFERLAERRGEARPSQSRRRPGLGLAAGVTVFLVTALGPAWGFAVLPLAPGIGPMGGIIVMYAVVVGIVGVVSLIIGVVAELLRVSRDRPRRG